MRVELHPCYILHQRPYRETSLLLEVFSLQHGRLGMIAKGVKRGRRNQAVLLQPFHRLNLAWSGRSELVKLTAVERSGESLHLNARHLMSAFYLNELLMRLLHRHEPHQDLFQVYETCLLQLASADDEGRVLRIFEKYLLKCLGYGLVLDRETLTGERIRPDREYYYHFEHGPDAGKLSSLDAVRVSGRTLLALNDEDRWDEEIAREAKNLLRHVIDSHLDAPLHSRDLYRAYLQNRALS